MSDIDDILGEFDTPAPDAGGIGRYIPDPAEFGSTYAEASQSGWENLKAAGSDIWNKGATPVNVGMAALAGLEYLSSPFVAAGKYLGNPVERGISDAGYPTVGKVIGDTVGIAPLMMAPGPALARTAKVGAEGLGMLTGERAGAQMAMEGIGARLGARGAPAVANDIDNILEEFEPTTRQTSAMKNIKDLEADMAARGFISKSLGEGTSFPPPGGETPGNVRLLHKPNPKVGEKKYAASGDVLEGYEPPSNVLSFRTSHVPKGPPEPTADEAWPRIESQLPWKLPEGQAPAGQMPLMPGVAERLPPGMVDTKRMHEMYMPNVRENTQPDPRVLAELRLKYGMTPRAQGPQSFQEPEQALRTPQPVSMPGAYPMGEQRTVVQFPNEDMPVPMGIEARQNVNRLRGDLGLPQDAAEAQRASRAQLPERPPIAEPAVTPAGADKDVTRYGDIEVGQPYDLVMKMGGDEMRSPGGVVKELITKNEPVVEQGKSIVRPVGYAVLEDGRQVPTKLLQRSGDIQPNVRMMAESAKPVQNIGNKGQPKPLTPEEQAAVSAQADPAFKNVQDAMAKKGATQYDPKDVGSVQKMIKDLLREGNGQKVTFSQMRDRAPGVSNSTLNKAIDGFKGTRDANIIRQSEKGTSENFVLRRKLSTEEKALTNRATSDSRKDANFESGMKSVRKSIKEATSYLRNFSSAAMERAGSQVSNKEIANRFNKMIDSGELRVTDEATGEPIKKLNPGMFDDLENDYLITFSKKAKPKDKTLNEGVQSVIKGKKTLQAAAVEKLTAEYNNGDITGTEFLSALKKLEKKPKAKK